MNVPRPEYPRPQFVRDDWLNLNGQWQFEVDQGDTGLARGLCERQLTDEVTVPFSPSTKMSGVGNTDFMIAVWYRREVDIPAAWAGRGVLLHFQGVSTDACVWVNGKEVYKHRGGWSPFTIDLSKVVSPGETMTIVLRARHDTRKLGAYGKQSMAGVGQGGCTRITGIWQTVWLEPVAAMHLKRPRITPDVANHTFRIAQPISRNCKGARLRAKLLWDGEEIASAEVRADLDFAPMLDLVIPEDNVHLWGPGEGNLYDITLELLDADGNVVDSAAAYAGLRCISIDGMAVKINGKTVFQRLVLDQGQYLESSLTGPSDEMLKKDIEIALAAGFNGSRLHEKVFEERTLYWADKLGFMVWGEFGDWGYDVENPGLEMVTQWQEELQRDYNHPSIIGWCGMNETVKPIDDNVQAIDMITRAMFQAAKAIDTTRLVLDASGHAHRVPETDVWDSHDYDYRDDRDEWTGHHAKLADGEPHHNIPSWINKVVNLPYGGQPYFCSELGGLWWAPRDRDNEKSWGYGGRPDDVETFLENTKFYLDFMLDNPNVFGYCYTQLTDTGTEQNGVVYQDRTLKFDLAMFKALQDRPAAIELLDE